MRIVFTVDTDVDIKTLPKTAYGALGLKRSVVVVTPKEGDDPAAPPKTLPGPMGHFFRKGWEVELPENLASPLLASGAAELVAGRTVTVKEMGDTDAPANSREVRTFTQQFRTETTK